MIVSMEAWAIALWIADQTRPPVERSTVSMLATELIAEWIDELQRQVRQRIESLSSDELPFRPDPGGNSVGVTVWHFARWLDLMAVCAFGGRPADQQLWFTQGWAARTGYDPRGLGVHGYGTLTGYTLEEVARVPALTAAELLAYLEQACQALRTQVLAIGQDDLHTPPPGPASPESPHAGGAGDDTRLQWLTGILTGSFRHTGEIETLNAMRRRLTPASSPSSPSSQRVPS
jgi:hypothetical protein